MLYKPTRFLSLAILCSLVYGAEYSQYILAPKSRTLYPLAIHSYNITGDGSVKNAANLLGPPNGGIATFHGPAAVTYDFGINIAGIVMLDIASGSKNQFVGITFTESSQWISSYGSDSTALYALDEPLWFSGAGAHAAEPKYQRGAFRYMTVSTNGTGTVKLSALSVYFTSYPDAADDAIGDYPGFFHSNDEKLNKVWYAGAWTCQLCIIPADAGNSLQFPDIVFSMDPLVPWFNNFTIVNGTSAIVDGAKRDRTVWPGDMTIELPSIFVSSGDLTSVRNGLESLYTYQNASGALPYSGVNWQVYVFSFTYHCHTLTSTHDYFMFTGDKAWLKTYWPQIKLATNFALSMVDETGLANIFDGTGDWLRGDMGGYNIEANAILYRTLNYMIQLAIYIDDPAPITTWTNAATAIKSAANALLWSTSANLYTDNPNTTLMPQDGNVFAIVSELADYANRSALISAALQKRWTPYGPLAPEASDVTISPFISSYELFAHFDVEQPDRALDLMRFMWHDFMLEDPRMTGSSFIEGYSINGSQASTHYPAYPQDARVSHAHGWSTGPVYALTTYVAGIHLTSPAGRTWLFSPQPGNLTQVSAGYITPLGAFNASYSVVGDDETAFLYEFAAPMGTSGNVSVATPVGCGTRVGRAVLTEAGGKNRQKKVVAGRGVVEFDRVRGGSSVLYFTC